MKKIILFLLPMLFVCVGFSQVTYSWVKADSITVNDLIVDDSLYGDGSKWTTDTSNFNNTIVGRGIHITNAARGNQLTLFGKDVYKDGVSGGNAQTAFGYHAMYDFNGTGDHNGAFGVNGLSELKNGSYCWSFGYENTTLQGSSSTLWNVLLLGSFAGKYLNEDSVIIIDNLNRLDHARQKSNALFYGETNIDSSQQKLYLGGGG